MEARTAATITLEVEVGVVEVEELVVEVGLATTSTCVTVAQAAVELYSSKLEGAAPGVVELVLELELAVDVEEAEDVEETDVVEVVKVDVDVAGSM